MSLLPLNFQNLSINEKQKQYLSPVFDIYFEMHYNFPSNLTTFKTILTFKSLICCNR